ncbi:5-oxoprolinase subunit PxpA [Luteirhabdus pelagi]|uniref:5-oxoprolinase subunit PxpA n=1 Tax=Luteirhabdus pelagi TaxID=2792783 RepID=UPI001939F1AE|nr:5-oxoprolinase subunit PxpA [Luteirhabdus pelagi]
MYSVEIDINADLGEGKGNDADIMPLISSCNIACGGHFGTDETMRTAIRLAKRHQVKIGAHPSFPDKDNFGREIMTLTKKELTETIFNQLLHFFAVAETEEATVHHIKLHGALYNYAVQDAPTADAVVEAITSTKIRPVLYVQYGSVLHRKAENLLPLQFEAFLDRRYTDEGRLVSRSNDRALIEDSGEVWKQLQEMSIDKQVTTISGKKIPVEASTYCIHGDQPNSVAILKYLHQQMKNHPIQLSR